jgi:hypothetical protein
MKNFKKRKRIVNIKNNFASYFLILTILNNKNIIINYVKEKPIKTFLNLKYSYSVLAISKTKDIRFL